MGRTKRKWQRIAAFAVAGSLGAAALVQAQFNSLNDRRGAVLEGNWQSCRERPGEYSERVYDGRWPGFPPFELHLGPHHQFAFFWGIQDEHRDHNSADNLLRPHTVELRGNRASHRWAVGDLQFEVALLGGSRDDCESWYIRLLPATSSSH